MSFLLNSVLRNRRQTEKTLIVKYTIKNFTCDLCVCEHISESRYFTSTPHASKNIKTHIWATNNNRGNKSCTRGNFSPPLTKCNPGKNVIINIAMLLTKILPGFTITILGRISVGPSAMLLTKNTSWFHHQYSGEDISGSIIHF